MAENNEKYDLYTEKINQPPAVKYRKVIRVAKHVILTVFLSLIAGACFGYVAKAIIGNIENGQEHRNEVTIPNVEPVTKAISAINPTIEEPETDENGIEKLPVETVEEPILEVPFYMTQYAELNGLLNEIRRSVFEVRTTSYHGDDYLASIWEEKQGNCLLFAENGIEYLFLTQYDLCQEADVIELTLPGDYNVKARVIQGNTITNTAVIAVDISTIPHLIRKELRMVTLGNSYLVAQGQPIVAIGRLYGLANSVEYGMAVNTSNIVYDEDGRFNMLYTNIASEVNNSGFLFNVNGEAVGVITGKYASGGNIMAYGISDLSKIMENMSNHKEIAYLGIVGYDISEKDAVEHGIPIGAYVTRVEPGSPAFLSGIQAGDIITKLGDRSILNMYNVSMALCEYAPERRVDVMVYRKGKDGYVPIEFNVTLSVK